MYSQLQSQIQQLEQSMSDKEGTIETLERQLVQQGIKNKVMQADVEINKKAEQVKSEIESDALGSEAKAKLLQQTMAQNVNNANTKMGLEIDKAINNLQNSEKQD